MLKNNQISSIEAFEDFAYFGWCGGRRIPGKHPGFDRIHLSGGAVGIVAKLDFSDQRRRIRTSAVPCGHHEAALDRFLSEFIAYQTIQNLTNPRRRIINLLCNPRAGEMMKKLHDQKRISCADESLNEKDMDILVEFRKLGYLVWTENSFATTELFNKLFKQLFSKK